MKNRMINIPVRPVNKIAVGAQLSVEDEVRRIAAISYDTFIKAGDALIVAIYASHPSACAKLLRLPEGDPGRWAAEVAKALHFNPELIPTLAAGGYFEAQLRALLEIAQKDIDHGAKLAQVFVCMLEHQQEHRLSEALVNDLQQFVAMCRFRDGFVLVEQNDDECRVVSVALRR